MRGREVKSTPSGTGGGGVQCYLPSDLTGGWHDARLCGCLQWAVAIGLSPLTTARPIPHYTTVNKTPPRPPKQVSRMAQEPNRRNHRPSGRRLDQGTHSCCPMQCFRHP